MKCIMHVIWFSSRTRCYLGHVILKISLEYRNVKISHTETEAFILNPESLSRIALSREDTNSWIIHERRRQGFDLFSIVDKVSSSAILCQLSRLLDNISRLTKEVNRIKLIFLSFSKHLNSLNLLMKSRCIVFVVNYILLTLLFLQI